MTRSIAAASRWQSRAPHWPSLGALDRLAAGMAAVLLAAIMLASSSNDEPTDDLANADLIGRSGADSRPASEHGVETVAQAYAGAPYYYRDDLALKRNDGTNMVLKDMGWDGDAFYFPIDGGARVTRWSGSLGTMVDFLHNKAVARLGKGAHGRKIKNGVVESVETTGTLKGQTAPSPLRLTDLVDRLEFTHGHNVLLLTGVARFGALTPRVRPYVGVGFGVAVPHVEVRFTGEPRENWTNEYQYSGPAFQLLAGLELRSGRGAYFVEYKFIWSSIEAALTGGNSWSLKDLNVEWLPRWFIEPFSGLTEMPGDLWRQFQRWRTGEPAAEGSIATHLVSHQLVLGGGYVWPGSAPANVTPPAP